MFVIVGLGNPGSRYEDTRHNIGFKVVDELVRRAGLGAARSRFKAQGWEGGLPGAGSVLLIKPQTFMNLSGESVGPALGFYKLGVDKLVVVHDEVDLPFGEVRAKEGGGLAGHNGLKSIAQILGSRDFARVRVGVGRPPGRQEVASFVLSAFSTREREDIPFVVDRAADVTLTIVRDGIGAAMNKFNGQSAVGV